LRSRPRKRAPAAPAEARTRPPSVSASPPPSRLAALTERGLSFLVYAGLFPFLLYLYGDLDWGWHFRYGEYLLTHGHVLRRDIFSWSMEGYPWTNTSWLYDPLLYLIYTRFSFLGLSVAGAVAALGAFYFGIHPFRLSSWQKAVLAAVFATLTSGVVFQGLRSQVIALLLLSLLMLLLINLREGRTWTYFALPALFVLWANVHGSFVLGLVLFFIFLVGESLPLTRTTPGGRPRNLAYLPASFFSSVAVTFINPFTYSVYLETLGHFHAPVQHYVVEWMPENLSGPLGYVLGAYTLFLGVGFVIRRRLSDAPYIAIALALLYLAFGARRDVAIYMVGTLPFAAMIIKDVPLRRGGYKMAALGLVALIALALEIEVFHRFREFGRFVNYSMDDYCVHGPRFSVDLTRHLLDHPPRGRGFNVYDWGGYLIGRGVNAKLFIDGRMFIWERDGYRPIVDYARMYGDGDDLSMFRDYRFDWAIVERGKLLDQALERSSQGLGLRRWEKRYGDRIASYYVRRE